MKQGDDFKNFVSNLHFHALFILVNMTGKSI